MLEHDNVARLQDKLRKSKEIILMVQSQANMYVLLQLIRSKCERFDLT
jgi:hypothetical protein